MCVLHIYIIQIARDKTKNMFKEAVMQTGFGDQEDGDHPKLLFATKDNSVFICNGLMAGDLFDQNCVIIKTILLVRIITNLLYKNL